MIECQAKITINTITTVYYERIILHQIGFFPKKNNVDLKYQAHNLVPLIVKKK